MIETLQDASSVLNASEVYFCSTGASVLIRADGTGNYPSLHLVRSDQTEWSVVAMR